MMQNPGATRRRGFRLGLFIVAVLVLQRLFPARAEGDADAAGTSGPEEPAPSQVQSAGNGASRGEEAEVAVAIAVALSQARAARGTSSLLGAALEAGPGRWWRPGFIPSRNGQRHS